MFNLVENFKIKHKTQGLVLFNENLWRKLMLTQDPLKMQQWRMTSSLQLRDKVREFFLIENVGIQELCMGSREAQSQLWDVSSVHAEA